MRYTYYTAGSGGVGPTIMETSMLLAGTDVVVFKDGERVCLLPCLCMLFVKCAHAGAIPWS